MSNQYDPERQKIILSISGPNTKKAMQIQMFDGFWELETFTLIDMAAFKQFEKDYLALLADNKITEIEKPNYTIRRDFLSENCILMQGRDGKWSNLNPELQIKVITALLAVNDVETIYTVSGVDNTIASTKINPQQPGWNERGYYRIR